MRTLTNTVIVALVVTAAIFVVTQYSGNKSVIKNSAPTEQGASSENKKPSKTFEDIKEQIAGAARKNVDAYIAKAESGDKEAQMKVVEFYCQRFSVLPVKDSINVHDEYATPENCSTKGLPTLKRFAVSGDFKAQFELASLFNSTLGIGLIQPNDEEAFRWYLSLAQNAPASLKDEGFAARPYKAIGAAWVAKFYKEGRRVPKNLEEAFKWYQTAASIDDDDGSVHELADMLAKGEGTKADANEAERLLKGRLADDDAQFKLAEIYLFHDNVNSDRYEKAKHLFETLHERAKAGATRHESAYYLGLLNYQGWGLRQPDYKTAFDYLLEAARHGEPQAQRFLAVLYFRGLGALQSYKDSYVWAAIAAANGNTAAAEIRDLAQKQLDPAELAAARLDASKWGKGGNAHTYTCLAEGKYNFPTTYTVDDDTLDVRWNGQANYYLDVTLDGNKIHIHTDYSNVDYEIDRVTKRYTETDKGHTSYGTCKVDTEARN